MVVVNLLLFLLCLHSLCIQEKVLNVRSVSAEVQGADNILTATLDNGDM